MKKLKVLAFYIVSLIIYTQTSAQTNIPLNEPDYNKPKLFSEPGLKMMRLGARFII